MMANRFPAAAIFAATISCLLIACAPHGAFDRHDAAPSVSAQVDTLCVSTHHRVVIGNRGFSYTATAGRLCIADSGKPAALMFFVSYQADSTGDPGSRPVTFAFNGGPGAASMWLHLGAAGPWRAVFGDDGTMLPRQDSLAVNQHSWLPFTDLVFVDAVGTGYSRAAPGVKPEKFCNANGDIRVTASFIQSWLSRNGRWRSPKFLAGESYGATRAAGLSDHLQNVMNIPVNGVVLISSALDFQTLWRTPGNDLPFVLALPSYTATAWYHHRLSPKIENIGLERCTAAATEWAGSSYLAALFRGGALEAGARRAAVDSFSLFSGLPAPFVSEQALRIDAGDFAGKLLADKSLYTGISDARITVSAPLSGNGLGYIDPSLFTTAGPITTVLNDYLRRELAYNSPLEYIGLSREVNRSWQWADHACNGYLNMAPALGRAMGINKRLRVFGAMGYYDLTTPFSSQQYALNEFSADSAVRCRITMVCYPSGHMVYSDTASHRRLAQDLESFYRK